MKFRKTSIIIRSIDPPAMKNIFEDLDWVCESFDLGCEEDDLGAAVFKAIVRASYNGHGISSGEIMRGKDVSQAAITYHLNRLMDQGLIEKKGRNYSLRGNTLTHALLGMEEDIGRTMQRMLEIAKFIDEKFRVNENIALPIPTTSSIIVHPSFAIQPFVQKPAFPKEYPKMDERKRNVDGNSEAKPISRRGPKNDKKKSLRKQGQKTGTTNQSRKM